jgi:hypothetical protein
MRYITPDHFSNSNLPFEQAAVYTEIEQGYAGAPVSYDESDSASDGEDNVMREDEEGFTAGNRDDSMDEDEDDYTGEDEDDLGEGYYE